MIKKYKLYVLPLTEQSIEFSQGQRFSRITNRYIIVYTQDNLGVGKEVTEKDLYRLTQADADWLKDCNYALIFEETKKKEKEISESLSETIEQLETFLREEKAKVQNDE